jgi:hypothetical protein
MNKRKNNTSPLKIAVLGHKTIPSRQGGIEIVVEELTVRMAKLGHKITVYNRNGHHVRWDLSGTIGMVALCAAIGAVFGFIVTIGIGIRAVWYVIAFPVSRLIRKGKSGI